MNESMSYELNQKLDQRGYEGQMALGYLDAINDLMKIEDRRYKDQPQLNENQQTILDELKINTDYQKFNKFQSVFWLLTTIIQYPDTLLAKAYKELTKDELEQVFQEFSQWAHEQEEEK